MLNITQVSSGHELLQQANISNYVREINGLVSCPPTIYEKLYFSTMVKLAEFCQSMPYSETDFNWKYGFLERQLKLAVSALKLRRGILFPKNSGAEAIAAEEAEWTYAIFSASLMRDLYQLQANRIVNRY